MDQSSKIVLLFDYFSMESRNLYESFTNVGIPFTAAVVEDDGFLPEGVNSVYGYFCTQGAVAREEHPRYFNQIQVPEYWRIESTNTSGKVMDKTKVAPGRHSTVTSLRRHSLTKRNPGSEMAGVPASEIRAMFSPPSIRVTIPSMV